MNMKKHILICLLISMSVGYRKMREILLRKKVNSLLIIWHNAYDYFGLMLIHPRKGAVYIYYLEILGWIFVRMAAGPSIMSCLSHFRSANVIGPGLPADLPQKILSDAMNCFQEIISWMMFTCQCSSGLNLNMKKLGQFVGRGDRGGKRWRLPFPMGSSSHITTGVMITPLPISIISVAPFASSKLMTFVLTSFKPGSAPAAINWGTSSSIRRAVHPDNILSKVGTSKFPSFTNATFIF